MLQYDLVNVLIEVISKDNLVEACFIKGSLARGEEDELSNVDFYCVINENKKRKFISNINKYLESFNPILHSFTQGNKIVCIYENKIQLDFNFLVIEDINHTGDMLVVYDPNDVLTNIKLKGFTFDAEDLASVINNYALNGLYFYKAYTRKEYLLAFKIATEMLEYFIELSRYHENPDRVAMGLKSFEDNISPDKLKEIISLNKLIKYEMMLIGVKTITVAMQERIVNIPISETMHIDYDFFLYSKNQIFSIDEE